MSQQTVTNIHRNELERVKTGGVGGGDGAWGWEVSRTAWLVIQCDTISGTMSPERTSLSRGSAKTKDWDTCAQSACGHEHSA